MKYTIVFKNESQLIVVDVNVNKYTSKDGVTELIGYIMEVQDKNDDFKSYVAAVMNKLVEQQSDKGWNWYFNEPDIIINCVD